MKKTLYNVQKKKKNVTNNLLRIYGSTYKFARDIRLYAELKLLLVRLEYVTIKIGGVNPVYFLGVAVSFSNGTDCAYICVAGEPN